MTIKLPDFSKVFQYSSSYQGVINNPRCWAIPSLPWLGDTPLPGAATCAEWSLAAPKTRRNLSLASKKRHQNPFYGSLSRIKGRYSSVRFLFLTSTWILQKSGLSSCRCLSIPATMEFLFAYISAWKYETHIQLLNTQLCKCFPKLHDKKLLSGPKPCIYFKRRIWKFKINREGLHISFREQGVEDEYIYLAHLILEK